jgi:methyl-accepting chemotaxis protein
MNCPKCGASIPDASPVCPACQADIVTPPTGSSNDRLKSDAVQFAKDMEKVATSAGRLAVTATRSAVREAGPMAKSVAHEGKQAVKEVLHESKQAVRKVRKKVGGV